MYIHTYYRGLPERLDREEQLEQGVGPITVIIFITINYLMMISNQ